MYPQSFMDWINPLLEPVEKQILLFHTDADATTGRIVLKNTFLAKQEYAMTRYELRDIRNKLEGLAKLYELEVVAYPSRF